MHIWIHLTFLISLAFCLWIYNAICDAYGQLIYKCRPQIVEQYEEENAPEHTCELHQYNSHEGFTANILTHAFIVFVGYLSYNIL